MLLKQLIEAERAKPMSVKDVMALSYRKGLRSVDYDDLKGKTLKQILVGPESGVLVFFKDHRPGRDVGHFCLLYQTKKTGIVFFDPLGLGLRNVTKVTQSKKYLQRMLEGREFHNSKVKYQKLDDSVQTCGRWCVTRWNAAHLKPKEFERLLFHGGIPGDDVVVLMTMERDLTKLKI